MRNFWIETTADGAKTAQKTGPRAKNGGFYTQINARHNGKSVPAVRIAGHANADGTLTIIIKTADGQNIHQTFTR